MLLKSGKYTPASFQPWPFEDHRPDQRHLRIQPLELFHLCIVVVESKFAVYIQCCWPYINTHQVEQSRQLQ